ncbi:MAG: MarR family transcriptional regulator [Lachnospiraceae bacterium]|nr:MarR family transcriptional regulator [Robinsoniella sp.]MDY3767569.1 MarR family transcriptional regulator [Lachnospiraceae bacterium]
MIQELFDQFDCDTQHRIQAIFSSIFIESNRLQTACEKIQEDISMKQWLMLAMLECCPDPKTLTNVGKLMGCSRQNIKKLAAVLEAKGYLTMTEGPNHSVCLNETDKVAAYSQKLEQQRTEALRLLFADFSEDEIAAFYSLHKKLYAGIQRVEEFAEN